VPGGKEQMTASGEEAHLLGLHSGRATVTRLRCRLCIIHPSSRTGREEIKASGKSLHGPQAFSRREWGQIIPHLANCDLLAGNMISTYEQEIWIHDGELLACISLGHERL